VLRVPVEARRKKATAARHKARGVFGGGATWSGEGRACDVCDVAQTSVAKSGMRRAGAGDQVQAGCGKQIQQVDLSEMTLPFYSTNDFLPEKNISCQYFHLIIFIIAESETQERYSKVIAMTGSKENPSKISFMSQHLLLLLTVSNKNNVIADRVVEDVSGGHC
jgi:hypothetical protein